MIKTDELREKYLEFFVSKGHIRCPSDVLVPTWDPSVLFTPAGMNQFKDHFLGKVKLDFTRATTCQKCLRTGDIENVGRTAYHHTFFEMLGNFSFGDYFKRDAINWAWEFLTETKWLGIDPARLSVTVYLDDDEAAEIWKNDIGLIADRLQRMDEYDNFWPAGAPSDGPDGVCGPCSEIFFHPDSGKEVEIWNLVFTQFNRVGEPPDNLRALPSKNIDTGMGLERTAATLQGVETNYHIDILKPIVLASADVCSVQYEADNDDGRRLRRITDHVRACTFAIHENVYPGPHKEKYVIKRLLRRAVLDGHQMGQREPFLYKLVPAVVEAMKAPYPELAETAERVAGVIENEEANFFGTIDAGLDRVERIFDELRRDNRTTVDGVAAAELYQTYGVPPELFESMAVETGLTFDWAGFKKAMEQHGLESGKLADSVMGDFGPIDSIKKAVKRTEFVGYEVTESAAEIKGIVVGQELRDRLTDSKTKEVLLVLDKTPFYAESGGQVGDSGVMEGNGVKFEVTDTQKNGDVFLHHGRLIEGELKTGLSVTARVDADRRQGIRRAHSATHILHHSLQKHLGSHAQQQGSKVDNDWLRFDFTNLSAVSPEHLTAIEIETNTRVEAAEGVNAKILPLAEARKAGAMMLFGEKYPDPVRMVSMGDFSKELCGGTHLKNTGEVEAFEITSEESVSAGVRRIVALTGRKAQEHSRQTKQSLEDAAKKLGVEAMAVPAAVEALTKSVRELKKQLSSGSKSATGDISSKPKGVKKSEPTYGEIKSALREAARSLNVQPFDVPDRIASLLDEVNSLSQELDKITESGDLTADALLEKAEEIGGAKVVVAETRGANPNLMRQLIDQIRQKTEASAVLLAACQGEQKVTLVAGVSRQLVDRGLSAGDWVRDVAPVVGGGGGGKADMAQAGGKDPSKLPEALTKARQCISAKLLENKA